MEVGTVRIISAHALNHDKVLVSLSDGSVLIVTLEGILSPNPEVAQEVEPED